MSYNANVEGWLVVKGDRVCRMLQGAIELTEEQDQNETITMAELAQILKAIKSRVARQMNTKKLGA